MKTARQLDHEIARILAGEAEPETQRDVLRDLNAKYVKNFQDPPHMMAYLRRLAEGLQGHGSSRDKLQEVIADHGRLRGAAREI